MRGPATPYSAAGPGHEPVAPTQLPHTAAPQSGCTGGKPLCVWGRRKRAGQRPSTGQTDTQTEEQLP